MRIKGLAVVIGLAILALVAASPAAAKDRNDDGIPDRWEKKYDLSLKKDQARRDQDKDGARNKAEYRAKTNPRDADSDDDGTEDGDENAGTIESYDAESGVLVINLFGGDTVSGVVDEDTRIECGCRAPDPSEEEETEEPTELAFPGPAEEGESDEDSSGPGGPGGPHHGGPGHHGPGGGESACSTEDLVAGTAVHEAELKVTADGLVYTSVKLVPADPAE
jgi:hypothetical protein